MKLPTFALILVAYFPAVAYALDYESSKVEIVSAVEGTGKLETVQAGIKITLPDDWYTYWRMPGDSGLAPRFHWTDTKNIEEIEVLWPLPRRFETAGLHSFGYGYGGDVYLPLNIKVIEAGKAVSGAVKVEMMICKDICIPETHDAIFSIPEGAPERTESAKPLKDARDNIPATEDLPDLKLSTAVLAQDAVVVTAYARDGFVNPDVMIEVEDNFLNAPPEIIMGDDKTRAAFKIDAPDHIDDLTKELFGKKITATLVNDGQAVQKDFQF